MFSQNLKYYRLKNNMKKKDLAEKVNVTPMTISYYESGKRKPSMDILKELAAVLGVRISDFLAVRNQNLVFSHGDFRKTSTLSKGQQEYVRESVEEYLSRFMTVVEILGGDVLPDTPACHVLALSTDGGKLFLRLFGFLPQALHGHAVGGQVHTVGSLEVVRQPIHDAGNFKAQSI